MKYKIIFVLFIAFFSTSTFAKRINYCRSIAFDTGAFDSTPIELNSSLHGCFDSIIALFYNGIGSGNSFQMTTIRKLSDYNVEWNEKENTYKNSESDLFLRIKGYYEDEIEYRDLFTLKHQISMRVYPKNGGIFVESNLVFLDEKIILMLAILSYFSL